MSAKLITAALHTPNVGCTDKLVLVALANFASEETYSCSPSLQKISDLIGYDRKTVFRAIASLEKSGLIEKRSRGHGKVCEFHLKISCKAQDEVKKKESDTVINAVPVACVVVCKA